MFPISRKVSLSAIFTVAFVWMGTLDSQSCLGKDYFLTLAGGYSPTGNQASLEANVIFYQSVIAKHHSPAPDHRIYFADGFDNQPDLQVAETPSNQTDAQKAISNLFRRGDSVFYRNHQVPNIQGGLRKHEIRAGLQNLRLTLQSNDRLFVYVTAHGSEAKENDEFNTAISCWDNEAIRVTEFSAWLDELPSTVPVMMIMAQCYCGGFSHAIFDQGDKERGFAKSLRCGFYAQQHDLPAAGCRPDIKDESEYSSYFWGAIMGYSRNGVPIENVDCNNDGRVSLVEAHAYAVVASPTIDIPLRTSDILLKECSRIGDAAKTNSLSEFDFDLDSTIQSGKTQNEANDKADEVDTAYLTGKLYEIASRGRPYEKRMVVGLAESLKISISADISEVTREYKSQMAEQQAARRGAFRRGRGFSTRRNLQNQVSERWPELADAKTWSNSVLLTSGSDEFMKELATIEGYDSFQRSQSERDAARQKATEAELRTVKFRRLLQTLESIVLAENLPKVAEQDVVDRFRKICSLEESSLQIP